MRTSVLPVALLGLGSLVAGFPSVEHLHKSTKSSHHKRCPYADMKAKRGLNLSLDLNLDLSGGSLPAVDVTGEHAFQPPNFANGDQRGPCPGLNALANHGYIPRNGVVSFLDAISAITSVYNMATDLATILAIMGLVWTGDPLSLDPSFSIGGETPVVDNILNNLGGLLGTPQGLIGSHNLIESDSSNTRNDLYVTGNNYALDMDLFMEFYNMSTDGTYDMDLMAERAKIRFDQSIASNPNFYYGPFTGLISRNAGYFFAGRILSNHTEENPEGLMTKDVLRSFFAITGEEGNLTYREGWERIPENWYPATIPYGLVGVNLDLINFITQYPELASVGGNTGTVNSFAGIDLGDLTGGVFNLANLLEGNNLLCFVFEVLKLASPNALDGLYKTLSIPLDLIGQILPLLNSTCPAFEDLQMGGQPFWTAALNDFPGALKSGSAL